MSRRKYRKIHNLFSADKIEVKNIKTIVCNIKFIDRAKFVSNSLLRLVHNLLHKDECKNCEFCLKYETIRNKALQFNSPSCSKNYEKEFDEDLVKRFLNTYAKEDINKFGLILQKGVYPYEYLNDREKLNEALLL